MAKDVWTSWFSCFVSLSVSFSHAIESYTTKPFNERTPRPDNPLARPAYQGSNPISDIWSLHALRMTAKYIKRYATLSFPIKTTYIPGVNENSPLNEQTKYIPGVNENSPLNEQTKYIPGVNENSPLNELVIKMGQMKQFL